MDGLSLFAVTKELQTLIGGKTDKIQQPERDALLLSIRANGKQYKLLLCAHPENGRVQLTEMDFVNPPEPPAFCMLLRRRLTGGRLVLVEQPSLDRVIRLVFSARDELGDVTELSLIVELMGRYSNISFVSKDNTVLDCIRHVNASMSSVRILLPGVKYEAPPIQDKLNPLNAGEQEFYEAISGHGSLHKLLLSRFFGLSPDSARQLVARWSGESELLSEALNDGERHALARFLYRLFQSFGSDGFSHTIVYNTLNEPVRYYAFEPSAGHTERFISMSAALDAYYAKRDKLESFARKSASLHRILNNNLERCRKKLGLYETALNQDEDLSRLRVYGELILANAHLLTRGMEAVRLENYYTDPPKTEAVPLDARLSPQENAKFYFKRYRKGKAAKELAHDQCVRTREEIDYIEGQLDNLNKCDTAVELQEIRDELIREGYVKPDTKKAVKQKSPPSKPLHFLSSDGLDIYVGRNNQQNDSLTLKFARGDDWWFHTKNVPGSHVIVRVSGEMDDTAELPDATLKEAALLAAKYSKASASVPVDYCRKKFVKKPQGARPGMVIYTTNHTIYAEPDEAAVKKLTVVE